MQQSAIKRLLRLIKRKMNPPSQKPSAEISECEAVSDMTKEDFVIEEKSPLEEYEGASENNAIDEPMSDEAESCDTEREDGVSKEKAQNGAGVIIDGDIKELREEFKELASLEAISSLPNPTRYAALRDLGLTPSEAYLATSRHSSSSGRAHLTSSVPRAASVPLGKMTRQELQEAREIFSGLDDTEIQRLYKKVTN